MIAVLLGVFLALVFVSWQHRYTASTSCRLLVYALGIAALIYILFAAAALEIEWLAIELLGFTVFLTIAWLGLKRSYWYLATGWATHVLWDIGLHSNNTPAFVPSWYPAFCMSFDMIVAVYIVLFRARFAALTR